MSSQSKMDTFESSGSPSVRVVTSVDALPGSSNDSEPSTVAASTDEDMVFEPDPDPRCLMCPGTSKISCQKCNAVRYCSLECKDLDATAHSIVCEQWDDCQDRPEPTFRRAIYFPDEVLDDIAYTIRLMWLDFWICKDEDGKMNQVPQFGQQFGHITMKDRRRHVVKNSAVLFRKLRHPLVIARCKRHTWSHLAYNAVNRILDTRFIPEWRGPIVVYAAESIESIEASSFIPVDMDLQDFRHALDFLNTYRSNAVHTDIRCFAETVHGVRINCIGDTDDDDVIFENVRLPLTHAIFTTQQVLPIPGLMGIPILCHHYPRRPEGDDDDPDDYEHNWEYRDLAQTWLAMPDGSFVHYDNAGYVAGSVVLARKDGKPLFAKHVHMLWNYIRNELEPRMTEAFKMTGFSIVSPSNIFNSLTTREAFEVFYANTVDLYYPNDLEDWRRPWPYAVKRRYGSLKRTSPPPTPQQRAKYEWISEGEIED
ncbi:hypothetical protein P280DRAFT_484786 [Massarina eburnea CBS 473.64]|uniref:MYND-type domain-containing protein n=1 Tax=Massarina eburnea CBS 473.64 TaxID=1395130 RepID=A0A6A6RIW9_9PLEO|nr:hypothetical protein P280DRAFT_484786 [Massarina eburnea CBS 473.64]